MRSVQKKGTIMIEIRTIQEKVYKDLGNVLFPIGFCR